MAISNIALVMQAVTTALKAKVSGLNTIYDENLDYETAIKKLRSSNKAAQTTSGANPLFIFNRSVLRRSPGKGTKSVMRGIDDATPTPSQYKVVQSEFDINFMYVCYDMETLEDFEIGYITDEGLPSVNEVTITLPTLGDFRHLLTWEYGLQEKTVNLNGNYYKAFTGKVMVKGLHFVLLGTYPYLKMVNFQIETYLDTVLSSRTIVYYEKQAAYYLLHSTANDETVNALHATPTNIIWDTTIKKIGTASAQFDGVSSMLNAPDDALLEFGADDFTVAFWIYPTNDTLRQGILGTSSGFKFAVDFNYNGTRNVNIWASTDGLAWDILTGEVNGKGIGVESLNLNKWNCIVIRRLTGVFSTHINNVLDISVKAAGAIIDNAEGYDMGRFMTGTELWFNGNIDNLVFMYEAMNDAEVNNYYYNGRGRPLP